MKRAKFRRRVLVFASILFFGKVISLYGQNISSPQAITLPVAPATTHVVGSGQTLTVTSGTSITLKPGTHFQQGSLVWLRIDALYSIPIAPNNPAADMGMNWTLSKTYRSGGAVIGEQKSFFDLNGYPLQSQYRDITRGHVLAMQTIYDAAGRPVISTLPAPTNNASFAYKSNFVQNPSGTAYNYQNFDRYRNGTATTDKTHTPDAQGGKTTAGTLGWYYGNNNTWEKLQDATDYPYSRQLYAFDGTGMPIKAGGPGDEYRVGKGHEPTAYTARVVNELAHYVSVRNKFFPATEIGERPTTMTGNRVMTIARDGNGTESISLADASGQVLMEALAGTDHTVSNTVQLRGQSGSPVLSADSGFHYFKLLAPTAVTITGGAWQLFNTGDKGQSITFTSGSTLAAGYYRLQATTATAVNLTYSNKFSNISYHFYNQLGQIVASIAPEGVKKLLGTGINNYSTKAQIPFITLYTYDTQGRLISVKEPDATATTKYVYRRDGNIRFSQHAQQATDGRYSYTNYDAYGRPVESGEYKPGTGGVAFSAVAAIVESVSATGGLTNGTQYDVVRTKYDAADATHGQSGYAQDGYFLRGAVSMTEKYSSVTNNAPATANLVSRTWYSYDGQGQVQWTISYLNGLGYKTTDYTYDELGNTTKVVYQKNVAAERLVHYYEYDADTRLSAVYTNTTDNPATKVIQARYYYYLHGPLKRVELADKLQGIDYVYTADGKLKTINHGDRAKDPGNDGTANGFAPDVFGMNLEYHAGDYKKTETNIASIQNASYPAQYSGNLSGLNWHSRKPASVTGLDAPVMNTFKYDGKYQLQNNGWGTPNYSNNTYAEQANTYKEHGLTYDANGNIKTLKRNNAGGTTTANYAYTYAANTNKLTQVSGYATYTYDAIGRLSSEVKGSVGMYLDYDVSGKVTKIYSNSAKTDLILSFVYDEAGQRIKKQDHRNGSLTWYVYDAGGSLMGVYNNDGGTMVLREQPVYGAGRLGIYFRQDGNYQYALTDHLGSIRAVINRSKLSGGNADVVYYADYYPFGTVLRSGGSGWRYGYQGEYSERDGETKWNAFELRNYDPAIGRWLSVDPYGQYWSPYTGMGNNPILFVDVDGGFDGPGILDWFRGLFTKKEITQEHAKENWSSLELNKVLIKLDEVVINDYSYRGGAIKPGKIDFWDQWSMNNNFFSKLSYRLVDAPYVYFTRNFGSYGARHISGESANPKEVTEAGIEVVTSFLPVKRVISSVGALKVLNVAKFNMLYKGTGLTARTGQGVYINLYNNNVRTIHSLGKDLVYLEYLNNLTTGAETAEINFFNDND